MENHAAQTHVPAQVLRPLSCAQLPAWRGGIWQDEQYQQAILAIENLIDGETNEIVIMATVVCTLHHQFEYFHWTGFYRVTAPNVLKVGPYQGGHGCLTITLDRGVCGKAARTEVTQLVPNVHDLPYHIACSSTTQSEIVVPVHNQIGKLIAVLDVDSNDLAAFSQTDQHYLEQVCRLVGNPLG